jgi:hypothetical protein
VRHLYTRLGRSQNGLVVQYLLVKQVRIFNSINLIADTNVCEASFYYHWNSLYYREDKQATWYIHNLTAELIHDTDERISKLEFVKQGSMRSAPYEIGYLAYQIQEEYRKMLDKFNTSYSLRNFLYPMEIVLLLEEIEYHYWTVEHLCNMQHEVERKYKISSKPLPVVHVKPKVTKSKGFKIVRPQKPVKQPQAPEVPKEVVKKKKPRKTREEKKMEKMMNKLHVTRKKSTRWWWPLEYGWEIENYW